MSNYSEIRIEGSATVTGNTHIAAVFTTSSATAILRDAFTTEEQEVVGLITEDAGLLYSKIFVTYDTITYANAKIVKSNKTSTNPVYRKSINMITQFGIMPRNNIESCNVNIYAR